MYNNSESNGMSSVGYKTVAYVLGAIGFIGILFNLLVIFVIIKDSRQLWTPANVVLINLAIGDFFAALLGDPLAFISALNGGWYWGLGVCQWYAWLMSTLGLASIGNLTVMAFERWMLIAFPTRPFHITSAICLAVGVWMYAMIQSVPPLFGWGSYGPEGGNISCSVSWEIHDPSTHSDSYIAYIFILGLFLPIIIISASYTGIILTLKKTERRAGSRSRKEIKVTRMVAVMIIAFLVAWTPYAIFSLAAQYFHFQPSPSVAVLPSLLAKSSICYNPIIYAFCNAQFMRSLKKMLGSKDERSMARGMESTQLTKIALINKVENKM